MPFQSRRNATEERHGGRSLQVTIFLRHYILTKVQGNALSLDPVAVLRALMFFGMIWGITGAFLAAPITGVVCIVCSRIPVMQPIAELLGGNLRVISPDDH